MADPQLRNHTQLTIMGPKDNRSDASEEEKPSNANTSSFMKLPQELWDMVLDCLVRAGGCQTACHFIYNPPDYTAPRYDQSLPEWLLTSRLILQ